MNFDLSQVGIVIALAVSSLNLIAHIRTMMSSGEKKLDERLVKVEAKLVEHDRRIQSMESEMKHLPKKDDVTKLQVDMTELKGDIALIAKSSEATERATRRVEEFLLRHDK